MANVFKRFVKGILLRGVTSDPTDNLPGSLWHNSTDNRFRGFFESAIRTIVSEDQTQTLTNKTLNGDNNTFEDIDLPSLKTQAADAGKFILRNGLGGVESGNTVPNGTVVGDTDTQVLTNKTIDGTSATGTNTVTADSLNITYDNSTSGLTATTAQAAIDEVDGLVDGLGTNKLTGPGTHADDLLLKTDGVDTNNTQVTGISIDDSNNVTGVNDLNAGGNVVITGDLTVNGTTTSINTDNLDVEDQNITVNKNGNDVSSEGAGLTIERTGTDGSIAYEDALTSKFKIGALGSEVEVADISSAQVFTNKDIDGGTASNTSRITVPKDTKANLDILTRKEGTLVYATDEQRYYGDNGTELTSLGSSSGGFKLLNGGDIGNTSAVLNAVFAENTVTGSGNFVNSDTEWDAQSFQFTNQAIDITSVDLEVFNNASATGQARIDIHADNAGDPGSLLATGSNVDVTTFPTTQGFINFPVSFSASQNTTYWLIFKTTSITSGVVTRNSTTSQYPDGNLSRSPDSGSSWFPSATSDLGFKINGTGLITALEFTEDFNVEVAGLSYSDNVIPTSESPIALQNDGDVAYVTPNTVAPGGNLTVTSTTLDQVPENSYVIARNQNGQITVGDSLTLEENTSGQLYISNANDSSEINYIQNPNGETNANTYNAYDDGTQVPINGEGGAPTAISITRTTVASEVLRGTGSLKISKSGVDAQGEGISTDTKTVELADRNQQLQVSFDYKMLDSNYLSGDIKVYVYDIDNATLLGTVNNDNDGDLEYSTNGRFIGQFTSTDSENYRLLFHVDSTNTSAYDISIDSVKISPIEFIPATYQRSETIDLTGSGDFTGGSIKVSRVGNIVNIKLDSTATFASSNQIDSAVGLIPDWARPDNTFSGNLHLFNSSLVSWMYVLTDGQIVLEFRDWAGSSTNLSAITSAGVSYSIDDSSSSIVSNNELNQQTLRSQVYLSANFNPGNASESLIPFDTIEYDEFNMFNLGSNSIVVARTGYYSISYFLNIEGTTDNERYESKIKVNGVTVARNIDRPASTELDMGIDKELFLQKNDEVTITIQSTSDTSYTVRGGQTDAFLQVKFSPDFSTYGVLNPNTEVIEVEDTSQNQQASPAASQWYQPAGGWTLDLQPGTYDITLQGTVQFEMSSGAGVSYVGLGTSSTPGTDIIRSFIVNTDRSGALNPNITGYSHTYKDVVVTSPTTFYVNIQWGQITGGSTSSGIFLRNDLGAPGSIAARRVK